MAGRPNILLLQYTCDLHLNFFIGHTHTHTFFYTVVHTNPAIDQSVTKYSLITK